MYYHITQKKYIITICNRELLDTFAASGNIACSNNTNK
jgi:hypothetical protein